MHDKILLAKGANMNCLRVKENLIIEQQISFGNEYWRKDKTICPFTLFLEDHYWNHFYKHMFTNKNTATEEVEAYCKLCMFSLMMKCKCWATSLEGKSFYRIKVQESKTDLKKKKKDNGEESRILSSGHIYGLNFNIAQNNNTFI